MASFWIVRSSKVSPGAARCTSCTQSFEMEAASAVPLGFSRLSKFISGYSLFRPTAEAKSKPNADPPTLLLTRW